MYKKILVPLDGSKRAESILPNVEELSVCLGSYVIFMQVLEPTATMVSPYDMVPYYDSGEMERRSKEASVYLAGLAGEFREKGIQADSVVVQHVVDIYNEDSCMHLYVMPSGTIQNKYNASRTLVVMGNLWVDGTATYSNNYFNIYRTV